MAATLDRTAATSKIERLNTASLRRVIEPETEILGEIGDGQVLPDHLLSVAGLPDVMAKLSAEDKRRLSREEIASITENGLRFESILMAGFAFECSVAPDLADARVTYMLHEIGEETRHSRLFARMLRMLQPTAKNPMRNKVLAKLERFGTMQIIKRPPLLYVLVLGGEEIPDLFQKLAMDDEQTDPFIRDVNRYHRMEEARHLAYARTMLAERWAEATWTDRIAVRVVAPRIIAGMFDTLVHPGVYATVGLPAWKTWRAVGRSDNRVAVRHEATRPIVKALLETGVFAPGKVPSAWRTLAGVDAAGVAAPGAPTRLVAVATGG